MTLWIDAQISPAIAPWIKQNFPVDAFSLKDIGLRDAEDRDSSVPRRKTLHEEII